MVAGASFGLCVCLLSLSSQAQSRTSARAAGTRQYIATAYCLDGKTASGAKTRKGTVAADHRLLPLGSIVRIQTPGLAYSGTYTVADTGPAMKGRRIDLFIPDCRRAREFGRRPVSVRVIRRGPAR